MAQKKKSLRSPLPQVGEGQGRGEKDQLLDNAKVLRSHQTEAEERLWYHLRAHRFMGMKFKRQKPIGHYIVDFVCVERRLIIELDGGQHADQTAYDQQRDAWLRGQGYMALRFWNNDVLQELDSVLEKIRCALSPSSEESRERPLSRLRERARERVKDTAPSPPTPLPQAGEGSKELS